MHCSWLSRKVTFCLCDSTDSAGRLEPAPRVGRMLDELPNSAQIDLSQRTSEAVSATAIPEDGRGASPFWGPPATQVVTRKSQDSFSGGARDFCRVRGPSGDRGGDCTLDQ